MSSIETAPEETAIAIRVKALIVSKLFCTLDEVNESLAEPIHNGSLKADSLDLTELVGALEEEFDIDIPQDELKTGISPGDDPAKVQVTTITINGLISLVEQKVQAEGGE